MKELWTKNWKKALLWLCGYVSIIAYVIAGGYAIVKTNDKELHKTAKLIFVITLIFTAIEALISILSGIASLGANMGMAISWINFFVMLAKIGVYAAGLIMALFASPFLAGAAIRLAEKWNRKFALPLAGIILAGAWALFAEVMLFGHGLWIEDFAENTFHHPGNLFSGILTGLVLGYLVFRYSLHGNGWIYWASLLFPIGGVLFCSIYPEQLVIQMWTFHFEPICYAVSRATAGLFENHLYGLYPRLLAPLFQLIGLSVFKLSLVMALLQVLSIAMILRAFWSWSRNRWLMPLAALVFTYIGGVWSFFRLKEFDPYYEYHPIRTLFPAAALFGVACFCRLPERHRFTGILIAGLVAGTAICWNLDSGIPVAGAFFCLLALTAIADRTNRTRWIQLSGFVVSLLVVLLGWWGLLSLQQGAPLALLPMIKYQRLFLQEGVNLLPMQPFPAAWALILAVYLAAMTQGIRAEFLSKQQHLLAF